ncbi:MAG: DUF1178 family protein [Sphingomonadales bacterium]|nr:DUF1178 family protein [Sphingomonadales bacterium]
MIIYDLICEHDHRFEGWFHSASDFTEQLERGLLVCPQCASPSVRKLPSAIAIGKQRTVTEGDDTPAKGPIAATSNLPMTTTQAMAIYRQFAQAVVSLSEDVGPAFAAEARRMHYQQAPERMIRGQATQTEFEELSEEGIAVVRLPVISEEDLN